MRAILKAPLAAWGMAVGDPPRGIAFLIYHSVAGRTRLELDTPFATFRRQLAHLVRSGGVARYEDAVAALGGRDRRAAGRYVLTFDDGYADTARLVFPLARDLGVPFTVFAATGPLERDPAALRGWRRADLLPPLSWEDLGAMRESGLVTVGAHTHAHANLDTLDEAAAAEELERSRGLFERRLGFAPRHFAYPRARLGAAAERVVRRSYDTAAIAGGRLAVPAGFDPHRIPRVPVRRSDGLLFFPAKASGRLAAEERLYEALRRLRGGGR